MKNFLSFLFSLSLVFITLTAQYCMSAIHLQGREENGKAISFHPLLVVGPSYLFFFKPKLMEKKVKSFFLFFFSV